MIFVYKILCFFIVRQPFSSILNSFASSNDSLPTGPFDQSPMLWDGTSEISNSPNNFVPQKSLIPLNSQTSTSNSKIQIKVIGKRPREPESFNNTSIRTSNNASIYSRSNISRTSSCAENNTMIYNNINAPKYNNLIGTTVQIPYIPAPINSRPAKNYRTYGKKRYVIGPEYADFVCRLQNDIPFDSSEDDDDEAAEEEDDKIGEIDDDDDFTSEEDEERETVKISSQELLELFEDSCSGLPGLISAFLTHRKHQIGLKGYKPRANPSKTTSAHPLLNQLQFDRVQDQIRLHFQFLIQNLALSNEIEGGEGVTLFSLKLLVQLHLHLDSICNLRSGANPAVNTTGISCLTLPTPRTNPITSKLNELIPAGIKKVSIIAGFLVRPGQKQFLSLSALRADSTLKPKTTPSAPPLPLKIKVQNGNQLLSNAFYNILALFHDYIDPKLMEQSIGVTNLSKYMEFGNESAPTRTAKFLSSEDNLLLCGLHRFGCGNWESIQAQFLPFRTARQLAIRYKNLSSRREPINPIKEFNERLVMPLSEIEEDLLFKGVQRFGNKFHLISKHYLPHRPATVLGKLWKAMDDARLKQ